MNIMNTIVKESLLCYNKSILKNGHLSTGFLYYKNDNPEEGGAYEEKTTI